MASVPIESVAPDALFVINRLTDAGRIAALCRQRSHRQILILSTHRPFSHEQTGLAVRLTPAKVRFLSFADRLDDATMAVIDAETTQELLARNEPGTDYVRAFQRLMTFKKNAVVHSRLPRWTQAVKLYADDGLGISWEYWRQRKAVPLFRRILLMRAGASPWATAWRRWRLERKQPKTGAWLSDGRSRYLMAGGAHRLPLRPGYVAERATFDHRSAAQADFICATIHDYWPAIHRYNRPVRIFADGYLPSNYSRSYLDSYGPAEFVAADPFSAHWLKLHGRMVVSTPDFLAPAQWLRLEAPPAIRTVICLLNHTGDWSALINRSDTDTLVATFTELAAITPEIKFVLRPHPGMEHADHEGAGAIQRLAKAVLRSGLPNLSCSFGQLALDLQRGDLFLSEYSATLLEAWRNGKPGIIVNTTGRRSFMDDFAQLGFPQTESTSGLSAILHAIRINAGEFLRRHNDAVERYNERLRTHLAQ